MDGAPVSHVIEALIPPGNLPENQLEARTLGPPEAAIEALLLLVGGQLKAWHNACPHAGRRLDYAPGRFLVKDGRLICAAHGAQFELNEGRCIDGPGRGGRLATLEVEELPDGGWRVSWAS